MPQSLTSDVLHGDGAGSGELPRHPEGFVTQLLVHQCTSFIGRLQQQVDRIQGEDGDGHEENPENRKEGSLAEC